MSIVSHAIGGLKKVNAHTQCDQPPIIIIYNTQCNFAVVLFSILYEHNIFLIYADDG